jgi:hypothetical protein
MTTRDQARRELKDAARLASVLPRERSISGTQSSPELGVGSAHSAPQVTDSAVIPTQAIPTGHTPTPPTVSPSSPLALLAPSLPPGAAVMTIPPARPPAWRGVWAVAIGAIMAVAMVSGLLVGKALRSHSIATGGDAVQPVRTTPAPAETTTSPAPPPAAPIAVPPPEPTTSDAVGEAPPAVILKAPRPTHHKSSSKALVGTNAAPTSSDTKTSPKASPSHSAGHDSLDDLVRKAATGNSN